MDVVSQLRNAYTKELSELVYINEPKKIKMSRNLFLLLSLEFVFKKNSFESILEMTKGTWRGIPVEIDWKKEHYTYELVYEEN